MSSYGFRNDKTKSPSTIEEMITSAVSTAVANLQAQINGLTNKIYPVGSIIYTTNNVNPGTYLNGSWESYGQGKVLVGLNTADSDFNSIGKQGGAKSNRYTPGGSIGSHVLTLNEIPTHDHSGTNWRYGTNQQMLYMHNEAMAEGSDFQSIVLKSNPENVHILKAAPQGGGQGHNHGFNGYAQDVSTVQPYQVVRIWRRIA